MPQYEDRNAKGQKTELRALEKYGGNAQQAFKDGKEVAYTTKDATRPDIVRVIEDHLEAIEVKNYNLENPNNLNTLCNELKRQVSDRIANCPDGTTQRIVLDVTDRNFHPDIVSDAVQKIQNALFDIYPDIPIDIMDLKF